MKNQIYFLSAIVILLMTTSCQKENLEPTATDLTNGESILKAGPSTGASIVWNNWEMCGGEFKVGLEGPKDFPTLHIIGNDQLPSMDLRPVLELNQLPKEVRVALNDINPNEQPVMLWQSFDPNDEIFIAEYPAQAGITDVYVINAQGHLICKGSYF